MNILQINKRHWDHIGGIETVVGNIADFITKLGYKSSLLAINEGSQTVKFVVGETDVCKSSQLAKILGMPISLSFFYHAKILLAKADFVIMHHPFPLALLAYWLFGRDKPMVVWYHSDIVRQRFALFFIKPLLNQVLSRAKFIVVADDSIVDVSMVLKYFKKNIRTIPFAVEPELDKNDHNYLGIRYDGPLVLAVGRLVYYKGFDVLIKAAKSIPAHILIIGDGPLRSELLDLINKLSLRNVEIINPVKNLAPYFKACDVFVLPSVANSEAFGLVQVEAMLAGKPVVNTSLSTAVPTVSIHGETGLTVEPSNYLALVDAINMLLADKDLRQQYGDAGMKRAETKYSGQTFMKSLKNLIKDSLNV